MMSHDDLRESFDVVYGRALEYADAGDVGIVGDLIVQARTLAARLGDDVLAARAMELQGVLLILTGDYDDALRVLEHAAAALDTPATQTELAFCLNHLGVAAGRLGNDTRAADAYERAAAHLAAIGYDLNAALAIRNAASARLNLSDFARAEALAIDAEQRFRDCGELSMALDAISIRGRCMDALGHHRDALLLLEQVVAHGHSVWLDRPEKLAHALYALASALRNVNRLEEADEASRKAMTLGVYDFDPALKKVSQADAYLQQLAAQAGPGSDPDERSLADRMPVLMKAIALLDDAIGAFESNGAIAHLVRTLVKRARITATLTATAGDIEGALREIDDVLAVAETHNCWTDAMTLKQMRAQLLVFERRLDEAAETLNGLDFTKVPENEQFLLSITRTRAQMLAGQGRMREAGEAFLQVIELYELLEQRAGNADWVISWSRTELSAVFDLAVEHLAASGDAERAYDVARRAKGRTFQRALLARD